MQRCNIFWSIETISSSIKCIFAHNFTLDMKKSTIILLVASMLFSCRSKDNRMFVNDGGYLDCAVDTSIPASFDGGKATDSDVPGMDARIFWEESDFSNVVEVAFNGNGAEVTTSYEKVSIDKEGADVVLDFNAKEGKCADVVLSGSSSSGSLKIYSSSNLKLTLNGVNLQSQNGPALNLQCGGRVFIHMPEGKDNILSDGENYPPHLSSDIAEASGCLFCSGPAVFSGKGRLEVSGRHRNGISSDGSLYFRAGTTVVVSDAAYCGIYAGGGNGGQADGSLPAIDVAGGLLYSKCSATAGHALLCGGDVVIGAADVRLYSTGEGVFIEEELKTYGASALEAAGSLSVYGGSLVAKASGSGGSAVNLGGGYAQEGGTALFTVSGEYFKYLNLKECPSALDVAGDVSVTDGSLKLAATGENDGVNCLKAGGAYVQTGGETYAHSYDDAACINGFILDGGKFFSFSRKGDGIQSKAGITVSGGNVVASGKAYSFNASSDFIISGGTVLGIGDNSVAPDACALYYLTSLSAAANRGTVMCVEDASGTLPVSFDVPYSSPSHKILFSSPDISSGTNYFLYGECRLTDAERANTISYTGGKRSSGTGMMQMSVAAPK